MNRVTDSFGRQFQYLRLSVTDACNFKCVYCLPDGYQKHKASPPPLSLHEIRNLVSAFAALGFWKIRLTGGEPMLRRDIVEIAHLTSSTPGIQKVALSTNGHRLWDLAKPLRAAGVHALNVSVDSLQPGIFKQITGKDRLPEVLSGIDAALSAGFESIKINVVLMKGLNDQSLDSYLAWIKHLPISVRFIELMKTGDNQKLYSDHHLSAGKIQLKLYQLGWKMRMRQNGDGPATEFTHPDSVGRIGLIAPYARDFCQTCNRLRVSSTGGLRLCLFGEKDHSLRHLLADSSRQQELTTLIQRLMGQKRETHYLHEGYYGNTSNFAAIGG